MFNKKQRKKAHKKRKENKEKSQHYEDQLIGVTYTRLMYNLLV